MSMNVGVSTDNYSNYNTQTSTKAETKEVTDEKGKTTAAETGAVYEKVGA